MSNLLNVEMKFSATGVEDDPFAFRAEMDIRYYNMGRAVFAGLESELMGMFKRLADMQKVSIETSEKKEVPTQNDLIR